jgi:hypothetical protein
MAWQLMNSPHADLFPGVSPVSQVTSGSSSDQPWRPRIWLRARVSRTASLSLSVCARVLGKRCPPEGVSSGQVVCGSRAPRARLVAVDRWR